MGKISYVAGWNMPGCLPEADPQWFDSFDEAKRYIIAELKFQECNNTDENGDFSESQAEAFCHLAEDVNLESGPFCTRVLWADGYVYWVNKAEEIETMSLDEALPIMERIMRETAEEEGEVS